MTEKTIIQNMISRLGQSQASRMPPELDVHHADVDERSTEELLLFTGKLAKYITCSSADQTGADGDWSSFFPSNASEIAQLLENRNGTTPPHLALFLAFLEIYKKPQEVINRITGRHLDFYYRDILRLHEKQPRPDKAHVLVELKKNSPVTGITPKHLFSAGKDETGKELIYVPTRENVVNTAGIASLRAFFLGEDGIARYAPVANSQDGQGKAFSDGNPQWHGFGHLESPTARTGFALASPVLRMQEGVRKISLVFTLDQSADTAWDKGQFKAAITGAKGWLDCTIDSISLKDLQQTLQLTVNAEEAVADYLPTLHDLPGMPGPFRVEAPSPVLALVLNGSYAAFRNVSFSGADISVTVSGVTSLELENDYGKLNPKKAFLPFGPHPTEGSRFTVGYGEALTKKLSGLQIDVVWKGLPGGDLAAHYQHYSAHPQIGSFAAQIGDASYPLFKNETTNGATTTSPSQSFGKVDEKNPALPGNIRSGVITFNLKNDFFHTAYRTELTASILAISTQTIVSPATAIPTTLLPPPYTPEIQKISLSYTAASNNDAVFFHLGYCGSMAVPVQAATPLLPEYADGGEMLIGLSGLNPGEGINILFQVAEGSADPDKEMQKIEWHVLNGNTWDSLGRNDMLFDSTNQMRYSGLINFVIPSAISRDHTILPGEYIWLKGYVRETSAICRMIEVAANAVEVQFLDAGNDPRHLQAPLKQGSIAKLKNAPATVKSIRQPYASFDGQAGEPARAFHTRVAERLRHKDRCITPWDYERIVLEAFPSIHKVKCIPHARYFEDGKVCWLAPGNVLLVAVPDLRNQNAVNLLEPKVDADTLDRIREWVEKRNGAQVAIAVKNPRYQKIRLDFKVRFHPGYDPNYHRQVLEEELIRLLSPWAYDSNRDISFGGKVYKSVLLDFVEEREYVDYVKDFKMYSYLDGGDNKTDINEARALTPDAILVSADDHSIGEA